MPSMKICSAIGRALFVGVLIVIALLPAQTISQAQVPTPTPGITASPTITETPGPTATPALNAWSPPIAFERYGWFPDIATDSSGRIHLAWSNSVINIIRSGTESVRQGFDVVLYTSSTDGVNWEPINEIAAQRQTVLNNVEVTRPSMLVDSANIMHMTYRDINLWYSQAPVQTVNDANTWLKKRQMNSTSLAYFSRMAEDSQGRLHMVYTEDLPTAECLICYHLMYRNSDNRGLEWTTEADISVIPTGAAKPQILVDNKDNIHVIWEAGRGGTLGQLTDPTNVMYTVSYNRGESWSTPIEIRAPDSERGKNPAIGMDGNGNLIIVWWSLPEDMIYYQVSLDNGLSWLQPQKLPGVVGLWAILQTRLDTYSMATDSAGHLHLVLVARTSLTDTNFRILHLTWDGTAWSSPETIISYDGDVPEWPRVAFSNGNQMNVVWYLRPEDFLWTASPDYYQIWYTHARVDAPYIAPRPYPELPTATPEIPTVTPTDELVDTPYPTLPPLNTTLIPDQIGNDTYTELGQLSVLAVALAPTLLAVGALLAIVLIRRR